MTAFSTLAIDAGQTAIKVSFAGATHEFPGLRTNTSLLPQLAGVITGVLETQPTGTDPVVVAIGTTGLTQAENDPSALLGLVPEAVGRVLLAHDSVTSFLGAIGYQRGVVVAAGTGVVTLGVGATAVARVDGWGNIMGDAGSGYWIGREALDAVMRAHDGRGPATALTPVVQRRFPQLEGAYIELQNDPDRVRVVAGFSRDVAALADTDAVAGAICARAGVELAHSAATAVRAVAEDAQPNPMVCLIGGVLAGGAVRDSCIADLRRSWPGYVPHAAEGDGLAGAQALPSLPSHHPLADRIATASR